MRVEQIGRQQQVGRFDREQLRAAMPALIADSDNLAKITRVPAMLNDLGVRFMIVRHLPRTYIDGGDPVCCTAAHPSRYRGWTAPAQGRASLYPSAGTPG